MDRGAQPPPGPPARRSPGLVLAVALVTAEALAVLVVGVTVVLASDRARIVLDVTTTLFFVLLAAGLLLAARGLLRLRRWSRGPVVLAQLIQLGVAWSFFSGDTEPVAVVLAVVAAVVLGCVLSPSATRALVGEESAY